jgi:aldehyde:ferredoxin oxidoreductase
MTIYGYGKILEVDLSAREMVKGAISSQFAREYIGGMGFGCKILYDEVGPDVDPLGSDNIVVLANGPLTGTHAPCGGRTEITTKSPLTGHIGTGNTGGVWGAQLKHAGFDVIVVRKQAKKPVYLWIDDDVTELRDASHLWGKDTWETSDILRHELAPSSPAQISVLAIGPAGENLVKYACPLNDYYHAASRNCAGAVMGAQKLKAIAVRGTGTVKVARPEEFRVAAREARERLLTAFSARRTAGTEDIRKTDLERGCLPAKNYQTGVLPGWIETVNQVVARKYFTKKDGTCYACPTPCFDLVEVKEGKYAGVKENRGLQPGVVFDWGAKCAINSLPAIWRCKELCQHLGMDYTAASNVIALAIELTQRGIITPKETDGIELGWGKEDEIIQMVQKIAFRDGFGDILAEGSVRAAERIGNGAEKYVMTIKGAEMGMLSDPRSGSKGWLFGSLTNPRGGDNVKSTHFLADQYNPNWWVDKFDMFEKAKDRIYSLPSDQISDSWRGKPMMCKWFEDLYSLLNALGICFFPAGFELALGPTYLSKLFSACTGWETTPQDMMIWGEKLFTLFKSYTVREGLTRKDDSWPDRFFSEPLPEGPAKGAVLSRDEIARLLDEYYELRGWDKESGLPTKRKLAELGLGDVADDLIKRGKLR